MTDVTASALADALRDRYTLERELGRGGMATVYLASELKHERRVALKVLHPELAATIGTSRFLQEIRVTSRLQHPHILPVFDSGESSGQLWYTMPFVEGESLRQRLTREKQLSVDAALRIIRDVAEALEHAHRQGIVHRDIKPENILLEDEQAVVADFGIARAIDAAGGERLTETGLALGTPAYMSPEQAAGQREVDGRSDIYSLACVLYEMLGGEPPFTGLTPRAVLARHCIDPVPPLRTVRPGVSASVEWAITKALAKVPADRYSGIAEFAAALAVPGAGPTVGKRHRVAASGVHAAAGDQAPRRRLRRALLVAGVLLVAVLGAALWLGPGRHAREQHWAREQAIPRLLALGEAGNWETAYTLARKVDAILPGDSLFNALRPRFAQRISIRTSPPGATVWRKDYAAPDSTWILLGRTPLDSALLALGGIGVSFLDANRLRIELPGYRTLDLSMLPFEDSVIVLDRENAIPPEMVRVAGGELNVGYPPGVGYPGFEHVKPIRLGDYLMDRYEVTNREFKAFVDSGGYRRRELWEYPFVHEGHVLPWEQGIKRMTDRTGRPGPSTWEAGEYPSGQEKDPVGGVSWYEAAAFAKFAGKALPTVAHWNNAAGVYHSAEIIPLSNFSGHGAVPIGSTHAISAYGTYDMAGNVREWCLNAGGDQRFILGGGWNDEPYQFTDAFTQPPFDRTVTNGIRLVKYLTVDSNLTLAGQPLHRAWRDFLKERPVPDAEFAVYRRMYDYDRTPLEAKVLETVDEGDWVRELVRMNAAYADDSLLVYLYLPKRGSKPYPAVVYFPGGNAIRDRAPDNLQWRPIDFIIKSGRAVLYPVYKGTYQRSDSVATYIQDTSNFYRDHVIMWAKDLRRGIDYLETRPEVSTEHLAYYGVSWGGAMGALMPAVEPRIRISALYVAGLSFARARPEVDPVNFLPRIRIPTLMLDGRYDFIFPVESSQVPMFRLLSTPPDQKRYVVEDGSHFVARTRVIQETLAWLDKYQPLPQ